MTTPNSTPPPDPKPDQNPKPGSLYGKASFIQFERQRQTLLGKVDFLSFRLTADNKLYDIIMEGTVIDRGINESDNVKLCRFEHISRGPNKGALKVKEICVMAGANELISVIKPRFAWGRLFLSLFIGVSIALFLIFVLLAVDSANFGDWLPNIILLFIIIVICVLENLFVVWIARRLP